MQILFFMFSTQKIINNSPMIECHLQNGENEQIWSKYFEIFLIDDSDKTFVFRPASLNLKTKA